MLVWHGLVPPSPQHRSIMRGDHTGAMGVGNGERVGQHRLNDLRPGEGGGSQAGSGSEVSEGSVDGDVECVLATTTISYSQGPQSFMQV